MIVLGYFYMNHTKHTYSAWPQSVKYKRFVCVYEMKVSEIICV